MIGFQAGLNLLMIFWSCQINTLFEKLAAQELSFSETEFLAPVLAGQKIKIKITNVIMELKVLPKRFSGWGVFKCVDFRTARRTRVASEFERGEYLNLFPSIRMIVVKNGDDFNGVSLPDNRFKITGQIPISLPIELEQFDCVSVRYDGQNFWFDSKVFDYAQQADYLREQFVVKTKVDKLSTPGLLAEHISAYKFAQDELIRLTKVTVDDRIRAAVERGGGVYKTHKNLGSGYTITYELNGEDYTSTVDNNLHVQSAGICLSGTDKNFDLQSLMSVIREGDDRGLIYRY